MIFCSRSSILVDLTAYTTLSRPNLKLLSPNSPAIHYLLWLLSLDAFQSTVLGPPLFFSWILKQFILK